MKKFNSTILVAAIALTSALSFSSCSKDGDMDSMTRPQTEKKTQNQALPNESFNGLLGSWHGTGESGTTYTVNLTNVNYTDTYMTGEHNGQKYTSNLVYTGTITVDGQTYSGSCKHGVFVTDETLSDGRTSLYGVNLSFYMDSRTDNSFHAVVSNKGSIVEKDVMFTK